MIKFGELSIPLKIGIVFAWVVGIIYSVAAISGLIVGFISVLTP